MADVDTHDEKRLHDIELLRRLSWLTKLRPAALGSFLVKVLGPQERRRILRVENGLRIYADPFTHLGKALLQDGSLEPDTERVFRAHVRRGGVVLDVGANQGYFSALAGTIVGPDGLVIAIEPQSRLRDVIEINMRLNEIARFRIFTNALGGDDGAQGVLNLWPAANSGASSIVRKYRFSAETEEFSFISVSRLMQECEVERFDFVKVDVEGFEAEVVRALHPMLQQGRVGKLFLDYHESILAVRGIRPNDIHNEILSCGYKALSGNEESFKSYFLYTRASDQP